MDTLKSLHGAVDKIGNLFDAGKPLPSFIAATSVVRVPANRSWTAWPVLLLARMHHSAEAKGVTLDVGGSRKPARNHSHADGQGSRRRRTRALAAGAQGRAVKAYFRRDGAAGGWPAVEYVYKWQRRRGCRTLTAPPCDRHQPGRPRVYILCQTAVIGKIQVEYPVIAGVWSRSAQSGQPDYAYRGPCKEQRRSSGGSRINGPGS